MSVKPKLSTGGFLFDNKAVFLFSNKKPRVESFGFTDTSETNFYPGKDGSKLNLLKEIILPTMKKFLPLCQLVEQFETQLKEIEESE